MSWQPIDFQRIAALDKSLVDQLSLYLKEKEAEVCYSIINSVPTRAGNLPPPSLTPSKSVPYVKLHDAVESFNKKIKQLMFGSDEPVTSETWKEISGHLNTIFWEYDEVLEGCVKELFLQLEQLEIENWNGELLKVMDSIKALLLEHIEDFLWAIRRLESSLIELKLYCDAKQGKLVVFRKLFSTWRPILDRSLSTNLVKSEKFLRTNHRHFAKRFSEYVALDKKVVQIMKKLKGYQVLSNMSEDKQDQFQTIYYYVKLWKYNERSKVIPDQELIRVLLNSISTEAANSLFYEYVHAMKTALFKQSRLIKQDTLKAFSDASAKKMVKEVMKGYRLELMTLGSTIAKYREFLLRTDPNPYVRTRWGFSDWVVGPEPEQSKKLLNQEYDVENVEHLFEKLESAIETEAVTKARKIRMPPEIQRLLHEMGQPLTSYNMARTRAEAITQHLQELDELGSFNLLVVDYCGKMLAKVLRSDWKHHVVHELPAFHELYQIHIGIVGEDDDRKHINRLDKFKQLIRELEDWVVKRETRKHERDIELDMNDLKGYLQDFLAQVQRTGLEGDVSPGEAKKVVIAYCNQLLQYRYLFGLFFSHLGRSASEGKRIRNKLLFVDQYFESIENKLHELRHKNWLL